MRADDVGHHQALAPARPDRGGVIMGREPDARKDLSAQRGGGYAARAQPIAPFRLARHRAVAGEGELAHAGALRSLAQDRSEEHTSELPYPMRHSSAGFCLEKNNNNNARAH